MAYSLGVTLITIAVITGLAFNAEWYEQWTGIRAFAASTDFYEEILSKLHYYPL